MNLSKKERTAFHEAGHIIFACFLMKGRFTALGASIDFDDNHEEAGLTVAIWKDYDKIPKFLKIGYSLAGCLAEQIALTSGKITTWPDEEIFHGAINDLEKSGFWKLTLEEQEEIREKTERFLLKQWPFVIYTEKLLLRKEINDKEIFKMMKIWKKYGLKK